MMLNEAWLQAAMKLEASQGRNLVDVSTQNLGFDIRSTGKNSETRYIVLKTWAKDRDIAFTPNEWTTANRLNDKYWLYIVTKDEASPELLTVRNPGKLSLNK